MIVMLISFYDVLRAGLRRLRPIDAAASDHERPRKRKVTVAPRNPCTDPRLTSVEWQLRHRLGALSQSLIGSKMGETILKRDIPWLVDLYSQGRLKLDELVSGTWSLEQINEAIADTKSGSARRNVILF